MSDTKRERIIKAIETRMATITIANGYNTEIGKNVFRAIPKIDPSQLPACDIFPLTETTERIGGGNYLCTMALNIVAIAKTESQNPSVLSEQILGDIRMALAGLSFSSDAEDVSYASGGTNDYSNKETVSVTVNFIIKYFSKINDPYT